MSLWSFIVPAALTVAAGAGLVLQQALNASLARLAPKIDAVLSEYAVTRIDTHQGARR